jgi:hypothetical protein
MRVSQSSKLWADRRRDRLSTTRAYL